MPGGLSSFAARNMMGHSSGQPLLWTVNLTLLGCTGADLTVAFPCPEVS